MAPLIWTCLTCNAEGAPGRLTLDPRFREGYCYSCKAHRTFWSTVDLGPDHGQARHSDPGTSHQAAATIRPHSAKAALLEAHRAHPDGLTDEEAAAYAGLSLSSEYATRCSELTRAGLLEVTEETRDGRAGMHRVVRRIIVEEVIGWQT